MATLLDLSSQLAGEFPGLDPILAETYIQAAWEYVRGRRNWFFLSADSAIVCPAAIASGTASFTQYATTVTLDATASAAVIAAGVTNLNAVLPQVNLQNLQIKFAPSSPAAGQIYNIESFDAVADPTAVTLTLNRAIIETTNATAGFQIFRCYITAPQSDFLKWESVVDMVNAQPIGLNYSSAYFDAMDPQRTSQGLAVYLGRYEAAYIPDPITQTTVPNATINPGAPIYELWPAPTQGQTFYCRFRRRGTNFVSLDDATPEGIMPDLILTRARYKDVYPYLRANLNNFPSFKGIPLTELWDRQLLTFKDLMLQARRLDEEQAQQAVISRGHGLRGDKNYFKGDARFPIDSNYMQSHLNRY